LGSSNELFDLIESKLEKTIARLQTLQAGDFFSYRFAMMLTALAPLNAFILRHIRVFEMTGVVMRIFSFSLVSWLGPDSPFLFVWVFNTIDAILLSWCAVLKRDAAYTLLNVFWIAVGAVGIARASGWLG
jgi:hypothetical protein